MMIAWSCLRLRGAVVRDDDGVAVRLAGSMIDFGVTNDVSALVRMQRELEVTHAAIEEELQLAREVQQALIPGELPSLPNHGSAWGRRVLLGHRICPA